MYKADESSRMALTNNTILLYVCGNEYTYVKKKGQYFHLVWA